MPNRVMNEQGEQQGKRGTNYYREIEFQAGHKYSINSKPPFIVYIWDIDPERENNNLAKLHSQKVGIKFKDYLEKILHLDKVGEKNIALTFKDFQEANNLIDNISLINDNWKAGIPTF